MGDLEAELFGDFESGDEGAAAGKAQVELPTEDDLAAELFGDGGGEAEAEAKPAKRSREGKEGRPAKRRKDLSKFYDMEAEEAGASEDEEEDGNLDDLIDDSGAAESGGSRGRSHMRAAMQRQDQELEDLQREMVGRRREGASGASRVFGSSFLEGMQERYKDAEDEEEDDEGLDPAAPRRQPVPGSPAESIGKRKETAAYIVPDPKDPKLWVVKTYGQEKPLCISLMRKSAEYFMQGKPVPIFSVFHSEHLRGYIYVESFRESDVRDFCRGITGINVWDIKIVPVAQMPQVFRSSAMDADKRLTLKPGDWVRMKRGHYRGDLAQVDEVKDENFILKLKPRIRFQQEAMKLDRSDRQHHKRPVPRWFNRADAEAGGLMVNTERRFTNRGYLTFFIVDGESYRDGFLLKAFKQHWFDAGERVRAMEHELQDWRFTPPINENTRPEADLEKTAAADVKLMPPPTLVPPKKIQPQRTPLVEGDVVIVHSGDLKNLRGMVTKAIEGAATALVKPIDVPSLDGELNISVNLLSKFFQVGDYVKVIAGEHLGDAGYVLKVHLDDKDGNGWGFNSVATVLSSAMSTEFRARVDHLQNSAQKADPQDSHGEFKVGTLVRLEGRQHARGMLVRLEAGSRAIVLCTDGAKHDVPVGELEPVALPDITRYRKSVWTLDRKGRKILPGTIVKCPRSHQRTAPVKAEVIYIHNEFCFMQAVEGLTGEKAYLVAPGNRCEYVFSMVDDAAEQKQRNDKSEMGKESYGIMMYSETAWVREWYKKMMGLEDDRNKGIQCAGAAVRITGGPYKGLRAEVRSYLGSKVSVSLLAKPKLITVSVSDVAPDDYEMPKAERFPKSLQAPSTPLAQPCTPFTPASPMEDDERPPPPLEEAPPSEEKLPPLPPPSDTDEVASAAPSKRRKPRLPSGEPTDKKLDETSRQVSQSPSALFGPERAARSEAGSFDARSPWLVTGVGVRYQRAGQPCVGWIVKVYADMAHVVSSSAEVGDDSGMHAVKGSDTLPLPVQKRGESVFIHEGQRKGNKGKVVGVEKGQVYVRIEHNDRGKHTHLFALAAGSDLVRVPLREVAGYSPEWAQAAEDRRQLPPVPTPAAAGEQKLIDKPWWEVDSVNGSEPFGSAPVGDDAASVAGTAAAPTPRGSPGQAHSPSFEGVGDGVAQPVDTTAEASRRFSGLNSPSSPEHTPAEGGEGAGAAAEEAPAEPAAEAAAEAAEPAAEAGDEPAAAAGAGEEKAPEEATGEQDEAPAAEEAP